MNTLRTTLYAGLYFALVALAGCGSPLVGLECLEGYEQCDDGCYDLSQDPQNCGACGNVCGPSQTCVASQCMFVQPPGDGGEGGVADGGDGGPKGDGGDAGEDAGDSGDIDSGDLDGSLDGGDARADTGTSDTGTSDAAMDGTVEFPDGSMVLSDGAILLPDGAIVSPDGAVLNPSDGSVDMDGAIEFPDGSVVLSDGAILLPDGAIVSPDGAVLNPSDGSVDMDGAVEFPDGSVTLPDGAILLPDGEIVGPDGEIIGSDGAGEDAGDAGVVVPPPPLCTGPGSPADCICGLGQIKCVDTCVDPNTDHENCGGCGIQCLVSELCSAGSCANICQPPTTFCNGVCADLQNDNGHCGDCATACQAAAACIEGTCIGQAVGHVVVIGHDMTGGSLARPPMVRLIGNAVFLPATTTVRVLMYDEFTPAESRAAITNAIAAHVGRPYTLTTASRDLVTAQLNTADVFVIGPQPAATNTQLADLGTSWGAALHQFLRFGGVVVVLDAGAGSNDGTYQILQNAVRVPTTPPNTPIALFTAAGRTPLTRRILSVQTAADAVATGLPTEYQSEGETAGFVEPVSGAVVIRDLTGTDGNLPIVIHNTIVWVD